MHMIMTAHKALLRIPVSIRLCLSVLLLAMFFNFFVAKVGAISSQLPADANYLVVSGDAAYAGSFSSPDSYAFLYVPTTAPTVSLTVSSIGNGRLSSISIRTKVSNSCGASTTEIAAYNNGLTGFATNQTISASNSQSTDTFTGIVGGTSVTYRVYCVIVSTSNLLPLGYYSNVTFRMNTTSSGGLIGTYPGPPINKGTGYFADSGNKWAVTLDFATPCGPNVTASNSTAVELYDLDNGYSQVPNVDIFLIRRSRVDNSYISAVPIDTSNGHTAYAYSGFGVDVYRTQGNNTPPWNNNFTWVIRPADGVWHADSRYELVVGNSPGLIGQNNKIRIRLPFDQIYSALNNCNTAPSGVVTVSCTNNSGTANGTFTVNYDLNDAEGNPMTLAFTDPNGTAQSYPNLNGTPGSRTFTVTRRAAAYDISNVTVSDGMAPAVTITPTPVAGATCDLPAPPVLTITATSCTGISYSFTNPSGEAFTYDVVLSGPGSSVTKSSQTAGSNSFPEVATWQDFNNNSFTITVTNNTITSRSDAETRSIGPCLRMTCTSAVTIPGIVEANTIYSVQVQFTSRRNYGDAVNQNVAQAIGTRGAAITYRTYVTINAVETEVTPALQTFPNNGTTTATDVNFNTRSGFVAPSEPTNMSVSSRLNSSQTNANVSGCNSTFVIASMPYVQSFLGDVIAGYGMRNGTGQCTTNASNIRGTTTSTVTNVNEYVGSGSQLAVFALGQVTGFRSAITQTGRNNMPWLNIFANTQTSATPAGPRTVTNTTGSITNNTTIFGGGYESSLCAEDWFNDLPLPTASITNPGNTQVNVDSISGVTRYSGPTVRFSYGPAGGLGTPITGNRKIFVDGDIVIGGGNSGKQVYTYNESWNSVYDIPTAIFVATGNIYIDDNVNRLDAILVARGTVFTCVPTAVGTFPTETSKINDSGYNPTVYEPGGTCYTEPLSLRGSIIADSVRLWRTGGTSSKRFNGTGVVDSTGYQEYVDGLTRAETIRLEPEIFLAPRFGEGSTNGEPGKKQLDSLISLPPPF